MSDPGREHPSHVPVKTPQHEPPDEQIDEAGEETFPASDPPAWEPLHTGPPVEGEDEEK